MPITDSSDKDSEENFEIDLTAGLTQKDIELAVKEYYERQGFKTKVSLSVEVFNAQGKTFKWTTITVLPRMSFPNDLMPRLSLATGSKELLGIN